jgi:hypothetical protein
MPKNARLNGCLDDIDLDFIRSWLGRIPNARITLKDSLTAQISRKSMH